MTDEERKAIKEVKHFNQLTRYWQEEYEEKEIAGYITIILNLIEKQSKKIEELKEYLKKKPMFLIKDIYSPKIKEINLQDIVGLIEQGREEVKDKIKAKIEEVSNGTYDAKIVLQSLLEKE